MDHYIFLYYLLCKIRVIIINRLSVPEFCNFDKLSYYRLIIHFKIKATSSFKTEFYINSSWYL